MGFRLLLISTLSVLSVPSPAADLDAPFADLGKLPDATVAPFKYKLLLQFHPTQGYINRIITNANTLHLRGESVARIPGDTDTQFVAVQTTIGHGVIDIAATKEIRITAMPFYPKDKPASIFRSETRRLCLSVNNDVRVRIRFKDATDHYVLRYADGQGLRLEPIVTVSGTADAESAPEFRLLKRSNGEIEWHCNSLTVWATTGGKVLWSTDTEMEGQPKNMSVLDDVLFVTTTANHSFYVRKDTGEVAFYDKSVLPGKDSMDEILTLGRENMALEGKRRSLSRFIIAAVVLNDRRSIPFLIDCVEKGFGLPEKAMAIAALEKFNGNSELWEPKNPTPGHNHLHWVGMDRVYPNENRQAEIAKWRQVFADELR
jgi:hypothetical protein